MASSARIEELRKKFEENPRRYFAPLANEYRKAGEVDEAIAICRDYLPQQPGHMSGHIVYGQALYEARQYEEAKSVFETALALDPENLIALRHLGDICLLIGDIEGARGWYSRVLEADPRNEEIQAQLQSLEASAAPSVATAEPTPISSPVISATGTAQPAPEVVESLSTAPTVVVSPPVFAVEKTAEQPVVTARSEESPAAPLSSSAPTAEIVLDQLPAPAMPDVERLTPASPDATPRAPMAIGFEPTSAFAPSVATQPIELDRVVPELPQAPVADASRLEGLETTSMAPAQPPPAPRPEPSVVPLMDLEISTPTESATPAAAPTATGSPPASARGTSPDAVPELVDLTVAPAMTARVPEASQGSPPPSLSSDLPLIDLGAPMRAAAPESGESDSVSTPPGDAMVEATAQALSVPSPPAGAAEWIPPVAESRPFVTETMAELYERQGHRDEALSVYRALLEQRPGDSVLQGKIDALLAREGPTIRELLALVASRRPASAASTQAPADTVDEFSGVPAAADHAAAVPELVTGSVVAPADAPPPVSAAEPGRDEHRGDAARPDTLAVLFGSAPVSSRDETAAQTLAGAFAGTGRTSSGSFDGAPARPATRDLSLDSIFGKEGGPQPSAFSFDQFFSQRSTQGPATPARGGVGGVGGGGAGGTAESVDDIAKFTQWLEGLKPR